MKYINVLLLLFLLSACQQFNQNEAGKNENDTENGLLQTGNDNRRLNDDVLIESRNEVNLEEEEDPLHPTEAEQLVRKKLGLQDDENTIVQYDHLENEHYIIHVYSIDKAQEKTEAWYMVNIETRKIKKLKH